MYLAVRWVVHAVILWLVVLLGKKLGLGCVWLGGAMRSDGVPARLVRRRAPITHLLLLPSTA